MRAAGTQAPSSRRDTPVQRGWVSDGPIAADATASIAYIFTLLGFLAFATLFLTLFCSPP